MCWVWPPSCGQIWYFSHHWPLSLKTRTIKFIYSMLFKSTYSVCVRMFVVQQIPESNLLMLVVQADCDCSRQYPPITLEPKEVKYILWFGYLIYIMKNLHTFLKITWSQEEYGFFLHPLRFYYDPKMCII